MRQPNQFHVRKPWRWPFETHTVISEGVRPGIPLGLLQPSRRVQQDFLATSCFYPPISPQEPSLILEVQVIRVGPAIPYFQNWLQRLVQGEYEIHSTPSRASDEQPQDLCWTSWDRACSPWRGQVSRMDTGSCWWSTCHQEGQPAGDDARGKTRRRVARDTASRHSWFQSPPWAFSSAPRSPFCLDFIHAVPKGISQSPLDKHSSNQEEAIQWSQSRN